MFDFGKIVEWFTGCDDDADTVKKGDTVTVKKGDSLWRIAEDITGDGTNWKQLADANPEKQWTKDYIVQPGDELRLPEDWRK